VSPATGAHGSLVLGSDGSYTYTLNNADPAVNALNNGRACTTCSPTVSPTATARAPRRRWDVTINGHTDNAPTLIIPDTTPLDATTDISLRRRRRPRLKTHHWRGGGFSLDQR